MISRLGWSDFKSLINNYNLPIHYREIKHYYLLKLFDGKGEHTCVIRKNISDDPDLLDFENNFKADASLGFNPKDSDGSYILKGKHTKSGWHYEPRSLDWYTSKHKSLYNRKHDGNDIDSGTDYNDAQLKFFDNTGTELTQNVGESDNDFQTRLTANCVKTTLYWQPQYDMEIIGGIFQIINPPTERAYFWVIVAPNIPENLGGQVPFASGGWGLHYFQANDKLVVNGRGAKHMLYDPINFTNQFALICKHAAGAQIGLQMIFEHFKA